jgi:hypothetical protein
MTTERHQWESPRPGPAGSSGGGLSLRTIAAASMIGNLIEIYDFILY